MVTPRVGPLAGTRVVELGGIGPAPFCGMILADLGAEVVRLEPPVLAGAESSHLVVMRGRRSVGLNLKKPEGRDLALSLIDGADAVIEGFRPGVAERLGVGPDEALGRNPRIVYGRMTGWGQDGPLAQEPGHDINYIAMAGAMGAIGPRDGLPIAPLNIIGDMGGGGLLLALGIVAGLVSARTTGVGQVVDAAMTDGTALQLSAVLGLLGQGHWKDERGVNMLDGAAPWYRAYRCADGGHMAVGCLEPQFYAAFLDVLDLAEDPLFGRQMDEPSWPAMSRRLEAIFATRTRAEWTERFAGRGACTTPVLSLGEAAADPHNVARGTYVTDVDGVVQPAPAPRFSATPADAPEPASRRCAHTDEVFGELGLDAELIADLKARRVLG